MGTAVQEGTLALLPSAGAAIRGGKEPRPWMAIKTKAGEILPHTMAMDTDRAWAALSVSPELRAACQRDGHEAVEVVLVDRAEWLATRETLFHSAGMLTDSEILLTEAARIEIALAAVHAEMERLTKAVPGFALLTERRALEAAIERLDRRRALPLPGGRA